MVKESFIVLYLVPKFDYVFVFIFHLERCTAWDLFLIVASPVFFLCIFQNEKNDLISIRFEKVKK